MRVCVCVCVLRGCLQRYVYIHTYAYIRIHPSMYISLSLSVLICIQMFSYTYTGMYLSIVRVGFININDMYNNDVGKGVVYAYEAYEAK